MNLYFQISPQLNVFQNNWLPIGRHSNRFWMQTRNCHCQRFFDAIFSINLHRVCLSFEFISTDFAEFRLHYILMAEGWKLDLRLDCCSQTQIERVTIKLRIQSIHFVSAHLRHDKFASCRLNKLPNKIKMPRIWWANMYQNSVALPCLAAAASSRWYFFSFFVRIKLKNDLHFYALRLSLLQPRIN